jgi:hypothetical protein
MESKGSLGMLALVTSLSPTLAQVGTPLEFATVPVQAGETITQTKALPPTLTIRPIGVHRP